MPDGILLKRRVEELATRDWDVAAIEARIQRMVKQGIPRKKLDPAEILAGKQQILERVQRLAEENNFYLKNCAQATALALMEEFGMGSMQIVKALTAFPSIAGTGKICGGISGSLVAFGLFFGTDSPPDPVLTKKTIGISQKFISQFESEIGFTFCADIIEKVILGHKINPGESDEAMLAFAAEKGFEKCGLPPGTGAKITAGLIIDGLK